MPMFMGRAGGAGRAGGLPALPALPALQEPVPNNGLTNHDTFCERHSGERAELRVATLDELPERRRRQTCRHRRTAGGRELAAITVERVALALIVGRDVDDERRCGPVVDEVVTGPLGPP